MIKRGRKTKFLRSLYPVYCARHGARNLAAKNCMYLVLRFDCNMNQLPGEVVWK